MQTYARFEALEKDFVGAFTKIGIKHSVSTLINNFKQEEKEFVRDCANRLRQYIARCPEKELPSQEKLVSLFLEGLLNKSLHADLYSKRHTTLNECIRDAIDLDDNCVIYGENKPITGSETFSSKSTTDAEKSKAGEAEDMVEMIMKRMNEVFKPTRRQYRCEACGGDHPTSQCLPKQNYQAQKPPRTDKWCEFEQKWTNHETPECYHRIRFMREQGVRSTSGS